MFWTFYARIIEHDWCCVLLSTCLILARGGLIHLSDYTLCVLCYIKMLHVRGGAFTNIVTLYRVIMSFLFCMHVADNIFRVLSLGTLTRKSKRNIVCLYWVVSNFVSMWIIIQRLNKWHFSLCCANMTEEVKPREAFRFPSSMVILAMHPLIKLIDSW